MTIITLDDHDKSIWNEFISREFPAVGAFLQSWEWGSFKRLLYGDVRRFAVVEDGSHEWLACFQMEFHKLPFGLSYGYMPRGPVLQHILWNDEDKAVEVFSYIREYIRKAFPYLVFVRVEPASAKQLKLYTSTPFAKLSHYVQPRFNQLITLAGQDELLKTFSNDIRHDIRAAERLGVTVEVKPALTPEENEAFEVMKADTRARSNRNIFPSDSYFVNFLKSFDTKPSSTEQQPYLSFFIASKEGKPVAIHLNLLFGKTLTYLYGASYSGDRSKRAPGYLHWKSMLYAGEHNFKYYDLGGVDDKFWHGLTYFKRQFGGETYEYVGTYDMVMRPAPYSLYRMAKGCMSKIKGT
jgi:lipid II:glycine glycyltransferase (peptidoglycan interpeptide bridge formation enzyme)